MEKELRESESKFRVLFEEALDGMILWDEHNKIIDVNSAAEKMLGLSRKDLVGQFLHIIIASCPRKRQELLKHFEIVKEKGKHSSSSTIQLINGEERHFEFSTQHELVEAMNLTVFRDVSEKIQMQEQLRKSDTLNVIGELAAGIAHEIRNPMTALKGFIQLLEDSMKEEHTLYYQVINSELQRIDSIINEFLLLAKPQAVRFQEKNVVQILKETLELLNAQAVLHNVQFNLITEENLYEIFCEPNQLKKVFINIIKNAIEVMPDGGVITVSISKQDEKIHITIEDQGIGIPAGKLKKLGEPFYTTKERGTGLGLMVSFRIIEEHKGSIIIESEEGKGSLFHIYLPLQPIVEPQQ
ncbi:MAG: ATP-binding protein [Bacillota bacterium]|nr:ATP-binding protein [Bacillota bacterium]